MLSLVLVLLAARAIIAQPFEILNSTIDGGGGSSTSVTYALVGTVGQADAGTASGPTFELAGGFWGGTALPGAQFQRGDCNNDTLTNIADGIFLLGFLFPGTGTPSTLECLDACDSNDDGLINIADGIALLGSLFGSPTTPLPPPTTRCGVDPAPEDGLDCLDFQGCP